MLFLSTKHYLAFVIYIHPLAALQYSFPGTSNSNLLSWLAMLSACTLRMGCPHQRTGSSNPVTSELPPAVLNTIFTSLLNFNWSCPIRKALHKSVLYLFCIYLDMQTTYQTCSLWHSFECQVGQDVSYPYQAYAVINDACTCRTDVTPLKSTRDGEQENSCKTGNFDLLKLSSLFIQFWLNLFLRLGLLRQVSLMYWAMGPNNFCHPYRW